MGAADRRRLAHQFRPRVFTAALAEYRPFICVLIVLRLTLFGLRRLASAERLPLTVSTQRLGDIELRGRWREAAQLFQALASQPYAEYCAVYHSGLPELYEWKNELLSDHTGLRSSRTDADLKQLKLRLDGGCRACHALARNWLPAATLSGDM